jgi:hypothetical protein
MANWTDAKCGSCGFVGKSGTLLKKVCPECGGEFCAKCWGGSASYPTCRACALKDPNVKKILKGTGVKVGLG